MHNKVSFEALILFLRGCSKNASRIKIIDSKHSTTVYHEKEKNHTKIKTSKIYGIMIPILSKKILVFKNLKTKSLIGSDQEKN